MVVHTRLRRTAPVPCRPDMRGEASSIATQEDIAALLAGGAVPARFMAGAPWRLLYSGGRHGYSLASLYRRAAHAAPTLLLIRDTGEADTRLSVALSATLMQAPSHGLIPWCLVMPLCRRCRVWGVW